MSTGFYQQLIEEELKKIKLHDSPAELYEPIRYMLSLGGKRLRPGLVLMAAELCGGDYRKAIPAAIGIEVFHNFTLLHDDIMDHAPIRRSQPTVHKKWNEDIALLSGDAMFVKSFELMMQVDDHLVKPVMSLFCKTAIQVCEGQQLDMNFENQENVSIEEYLEMIRLKTAVLLGCALQTGGMIAGASGKSLERLYEFGIHTGVAFQLHDDILDLYGDEEKFGKKQGGDVHANKKTFLYVEALEKAKGDDRLNLNRLFTDEHLDPEEKLAAVKTLFATLKVREAAEQKMDYFFREAMKSLEGLDVADSNKNVLRAFAEQLMLREV